VLLAINQLNLQQPPPPPPPQQQQQQCMRESGF
jgi:hypothetical protein